MRFKQLSALTITVVFLMAGMSLSWAEKSPPKAYLGKMPLEHVGMACTNCHGDSGPKNVKMGNHPGQACTDCHELGTTKADGKKKFAEVIKTPLAGKMMLEHENMDCRTCHGAKGPKGMADKVKQMMSHKSFDCTKCHTVEVVK
ncbi:hypothetical protein [Candidatus Magnetominusculus xianensis]|uniref:Uncharacterized protein n=1 Tax=Candidatus Magnetominusculus xianensis TaxID=1748249 RepID=A0ABR5SHE3_9BACT|nr:hypothetical protein [Candidatus Magnetominusculus xianensis]KWT91099.1 hypothetical protein ASN18_0923 [Candidatus Magnetominusculus xianensis]MBF0403256.1 hypothetical protein [Nitrospirota bacterium]